jgi:hypothetical protein
MPQEVHKKYFYLYMYMTVHRCLRSFLKSYYIEPQELAKIFFEKKLRKGIDMILAL